MMSSLSVDHKTVFQTAFLFLSSGVMLVSTTAMGIQICDQPGRSHLILPMPPGSNRPCYARFGGPERKALYVANVDKVWKRETQLEGVLPWKSPVKPPRPKL